MNNKIVVNGLLSLHSHGEASDILFVSSLQDPLAEELVYKISNKNTTVRYWTSKVEKTKEEHIENDIMVYSGMTKADYGACYSELTGYLWTDEKLMVGGHDLLKELKSHVGKWLYMEIEINK